MMSELELTQVDVALRIAGYNFKKKDLELILRVIENANKEATIKQILTIEQDVKEKYEK